MDQDVKKETEEPESSSSQLDSTFKSMAIMEEEKEVEEKEDEENVPIAKLSKRKPLTSKGKSKNHLENNETLSKVKKRLLDWKINHAVSGPGGKHMSFEQNKAVNDGLCLPGEFKSSAVIRALEVRSNLEQEFPSFVKSLVRSHVASCFWMGLPGAFCKLHLPDKDTTITLEDESGKQSQTKYIAYKTGLSAGWRQFSVAHKLLEGDVLVFQLIEPTKFKVYIIRANDLAEVDGALGLLNLDVHCKQTDAENDTVGTVMKRKHPKSHPLAVVQTKKKKAAPLRSITKRPITEQNENDSEEVGSEVLEGLKISKPATPFIEIKDFEDFGIVVDGIPIDSELPEVVRKKYYKLCCSQTAFLHENLIQGINHKLVIGTISETVNISDAIRASNLTTSREEFSAWDKTLRAFQIFGMNVGFLRTKLRRLISLAYESEDAMDIRRFVEARTERARAEDEIRNIEAKLVELKEACNRFGAAIESLRSKAEIYEVKFKEEGNAPW